MTFGGLALGIGLIVDNAIVVIENIVRQRQAGRSREDAARVGTREVAGAVVAATLTTCVILLPVVFMRTTSGQLFQTLALVVVFALACSLLIALTLVPMLASRFLTIRPQAPANAGPATQSRLDRAFSRLDHAYLRALGYALHHRVRVLLGAAAAVALAVWVMRFVPVELAPQMETNEIEVRARDGPRHEHGHRHPLSRRAGRRSSGACAPMSEVASIDTQVRGDNAELDIRLVDAAERTIDSTVLADRIRAAVAEPDSRRRDPGARPNRACGCCAGCSRPAAATRTVEVELRGYDMDRSVALAADIRRRMERVPGVVEVDVAEREGRLEENLIFRRERIYSLGLSVEQVGRAVQTSVGGSRAGYFREGGEQFPITVRLRPEDRETAADLAGVAVRTPDDQMVPVSTLVERRRDRGPANIRHIDGQRVQLHHRRTSSAACRSATRSRASETELAGMTLPSRLLGRLRRRLPRTAASAARLRDRHRHGPAAGLHGAGRPVRALRGPAGRDGQRAGGHHRHRPDAPAHQHDPQRPEHHGRGDARSASSSTTPSCWWTTST